LTIEVVVVVVVAAAAAASTTTNNNNNNTQAMSSQMWYLELQSVRMHPVAFEILENI